MILSIFCKIIKDFPSIFLPKDARQRSARQRHDLKRSARRLACLALKARDKETMSDTQAKQQIPGADFLKSDGTMSCSHKPTS